MAVRSHQSGVCRVCVSLMLLFCAQRTRCGGMRWYHGGPKGVLDGYSRCSFVCVSHSLSFSAHVFMYICQHQRVYLCSMRTHARTHAHTHTHTHTHTLCSFGTQWTVAAPRASGFSPLNAVASHGAAVITILGTGFGAVDASPSAYISGEPCATTSWTSLTHLVCSAPTLTVSGGALHSVRVISSAVRRQP
jgi:hypothetical protein